MARRTRKRTPRLPLPWERDQNPWGSLLSGRRFFPLLVVAATFAVLGVAFWLGGRRADIHATRATIAEVTRAAEEFIDDMGRCPRNTNELVHPPRSGVNYLSEPPVDAWGQGIYLNCSIGEYTDIEVVSAGPSGSFLDEDNVM